MDQNRNSCGIIYAPTPNITRYARDRTEHLALLAVGIAPKLKLVLRQLI